MSDSAKPGSPARTPQVLTAAALAFSVALPLIELWRIRLFAETRDVTMASIAAASYLPLHLRHVASGLQASRPRGSGWSLAVMFAVMGAALGVIGSPWAMMLGPLVASVLVVVRAPWSLLLVAGVIAAPVVLGYEADPVTGFGSGSYLAASVAFRGVTLFVIVWLVAAARQLYAARAALSEEAVVRERLRIEGELRHTVGRALDAIIERGTTSERLIGSPSEANPVLQSLVSGSRDALSDARRTVASYQQSTLRSELDAACALLAAAGIDAHLVVHDPDVLDSGDDVDLRTQLRGALNQVLREAPPACGIELRPRAGGASLEVVTSPITKASAPP